MQAVIEACQQGQLHATPCVVISNNSRAEALVKARQAGIPAHHLSAQTHPLSEELDAVILNVLRQHQVDLILLAGYLKKLGPKTLQRYKNHVLNIHPALLPKFGGQGMYGTAVHEAVLAAGEIETGVTIHLVDEEYDHGEILAQCRVPVQAGDTVSTLSQRVLEREHTFLVEILRQIIEGKIALPHS
jgi:phosphoribosylglycinamide formyltransferase 1